MRAMLKFNGPLRRERLVAEFIPYAAHLTAHTVSLHQGDYLQAFRLSGISFESADDDQINTWHERLNNLFRNIASPNLAVWQHIVRREESTYPGGEFPDNFAKDLNARYAERVSGEVLMTNELYLTLVYRPQTSTTSRTVFRVFAKADAAARAAEREESIEFLDRVATEVMSSLHRYDPERLGIYQRNGARYSDVLELLGFLVNGEWQPIPLPRGPINAMLATTRPFFGQETIELRMPTQTRYGAMLAINEYPGETQPGLLDPLLTLPFAFVLTQSFTFLTKEGARWLMRVQRTRLENAGDDARSQIEDIDAALDDLSSNRFVMGEHHFSLLVTADSLRDLSQHLGAARTVLSDANITVAREDLGLEAAWWAQLPGNFRFRPRRAAITSRNFAGLAPLHNFPMGRRTGNHWGDALTLLITAAGTALYFSVHAADPEHPEGGNKKDVGHTLVLGPTGAGKTVLVMFLLCMLQKFGVTAILFTKDRDSEICIRALGGRYLPLQTGIPTGCNPFQLEPTPGNVHFLNRLVRQLVSRDQPLTPPEEADIANAIRGVLGLPKPARRLGRLLDFLDITRKDSVYVRLKAWCYSREPGEPDGEYAWVFDNPNDTVLALFDHVRLLGFDLTDFLDQPIIGTPVNLYLFHLVEQLIDGRRLAIFVSEFWKAFGDDAFASFAKDLLKTLRKKNGFVVLDSQSPSDAINHSISRTLIEQTPTKILFPNPDADYHEYVEKLNVSEREFRLIKEELKQGVGQFLIKQNHNSVVAQLNLEGFDFELDVLSGRAKTIQLVEHLISEVGDDPAVWLPLFREEERK